MTCKGKHDFESPTKTVSEWECRKCGHRAILPHSGPQEQFLRSKANIAVFGGAKGGGKTWSLLMETTRHIANPRFGSVIFRRESPQIYNEGGLWDTSEKIYPFIKHGGNAAVPVRSRGEWIFPSGSKIKFSHLEYDKDVNAWDGSQVPLIGFDQLESFTEKQFWYMLTINRSTCGVEPYIRATCNPDSESWLAELLSWWINQDTGYPIPERSGVIRWFVRSDGALVWSDSRDELLAKHPHLIPKSLTFIPAKLEDNPTLERIDPGYRASLMAQEHVTRERLLGGNWKIRPAAGLKFPRDKWAGISDGHEYVDAPPGLRLVRYWDRNFTEGGHGARTAGILMGELMDWNQKHLPRFWIVDAVCGRWSDSDRAAKLLATAQLDRAGYGFVQTWIEEEPSAGKHSARIEAQGLAGFDVRLNRARTKKHLAWGAFASQVQLGNVAIVKGTWDWLDFIRELDALAGDPDLDSRRLKDQADAASGAFNVLMGNIGSGFSGDVFSSAELDVSDRGPLTQEELAQSPEWMQEIVGSYRQIGREARYDDDRFTNSGDDPFAR